MGLTRVIRFVQKAFVSLLPILFLFSIVPSSSSNTLQYVYDDLGRLNVAADENGNYAVYEYDEVGNLLSISNGTINPSPPLIQGINPDYLFISSTKTVTITGQNLLTTSEITSDNPALTFKVLSVTDTSLTASITVPSDASPGTVNITVKTFYGSANIASTLVKLTFNPDHLALVPSTATNITAGVAPAMGKDVSITINNSDPSVISVPQSIVILANGTTAFTINTLAEGVAVISSDESNSVFTTVYVTQLFTTEPGENVTSSTKPVSVYIQPTTAVAVTPVALPVSVYIQPTTAVAVTPATLPVSVYIQPSTAVNVTPVTLPVSVYIQPSTAVNVTPVTLPVSVYVQPSTAVAVTPATLPVSVYIQQSTIVDATVISLPISSKINPP